jgi:hypothetical protein
MDTICEACRRDGQPCTVKVLPGDRFCFAHSERLRAAPGRQRGRRVSQTDETAGVTGRTAPSTPVLPLLDWALAHRVIDGQPLTVIPPLRDIYASTHPRVVRTATQVFVSEWLLNVALWVADTQQGAVVREGERHHAWSTMAACAPSPISTG